MFISSAFFFHFHSFEIYVNTAVSKSAVFRKCCLDIMMDIFSNIRI